LLLSRLGLGLNEDRSQRGRSLCPGCFSAPWQGGCGRNGPGSAAICFPGNGWSPSCGVCGTAPSGKTALSRALP